MPDLKGRKIKAYDKISVFYVKVSIKANRKYSDLIQKKQTLKAFNFKI